MSKVVPSIRGFSPHAVPRQRDGLQCYELDGEAILYDLAHHAVHYLNDAAYRIWRNCDGNTSVVGLTGKMLAELEDGQVEIPPALFDDTGDALQNLLDNGLIDCTVACGREW